MLNYQKSIPAFIKYTTTMKYLHIKNNSIKCTELFPPDNNSPTVHAHPEPCGTSFNNQNINNTHQIMIHNIRLTDADNWCKRTEGDEANCQRLWELTRSQGKPRKKRKKVQWKQLVLLPGSAVAQTVNQTKGGGSFMIDGLCYITPENLSWHWKLWIFWTSMKQ